MAPTAALPNCAPITPTSNSILKQCVITMLGEVPAW